MELGVFGNYADVDPTPNPGPGPKPWQGFDPTSIFSVE
jgi:hypothetical protein